MGNENHEQILLDIKTNLEFENVFRLWMKDNFEVNSLTRDNIIKYREYLFGNEFGK